MIHSTLNQVKRGWKDSLVRGSKKDLTLNMTVQVRKSWQYGK